MNQEQKRFFVEGGKAVFTIEIPPQMAQRVLLSEGKECKEWYTYQVTKKIREWGSAIYFVSLLIPGKSYVYIGLFLPEYSEDSHLKLTQKSQFNASSVPIRIFRFVMKHIMSLQELPDGFEFHHVGRCCKCGRKLTTPESVNSGVGPVCCKIA